MATAMLSTSPVAMEGNAVSIPRISGLISETRVSLDRKNSMSRKIVELKFSGTSESRLVSWARRSGLAGGTIAPAKSSYGMGVGVGTAVGSAVVCGADVSSTVSEAHAARMKTATTVAKTPAARFLFKSLNLSNGGALFFVVGQVLPHVQHLHGVGGARYPRREAVDNRYHVGLLDGAAVQTSLND